MPREYYLLFSALVAPDDAPPGIRVPSIPLYECPQCWSLVASIDLHDREHENSRTVRCRCPRVGVPEPEYYYCQLHDRASYPKGPPVKSEQSDQVGGRLAW